jgi:FtsP/CotA-like multicopper oxidase with cupredoxin domain
MRLVPVETAAAAVAQPTVHDHHHDDSADGLEWEDLRPDLNQQTTAETMYWQLVDADTGAVNEAIDWTFRVGEQVKLRVVNDRVQDHRMQHPFHVHGAGRFVVIARDDVLEPNLVWKDTVLIRRDETVDLLLDVTNAGRWMAHCHIAEHNQAGMMFCFTVNQTPQ